MLAQLLERLRSFSFFEVFKHSSIYFIGTLLTQGLGVLSLPVFTYFMNEAEYGVASVFISYVSIISVVLSFNLHISISRSFYEKDIEIKRFVSTVFNVTALINFLLGGLVYIFREPIATYINLPAETIIYLLLTGYFAVLYHIFFQLKREEQKSIEISIVNVAWQYSKFGLACLGLYALRNTGEVYMGKIIGEMLAGAFFAFIFIWRIWPFIKELRIDFSDLRYALIYGLPLIPYSIGGFLLNSFDQWLINSQLGNADAGLYSFAYKIGMLLLGLITALQNAANPAYHKIMNEQQYEQLGPQVYSIHKLSLLGGVFLLLFAVDLASLLLSFSKNNFQQSLYIVPIIVLGYIFYSMSLLYNRYIQYQKVNIYLTVILLASALVNLVLNLYFIPRQGYQAAAYTTLGSYVIMFLLSWLVCDYWLKAPRLPLAKMLLSLLPVLGITVLYYSLGWDQKALELGTIFPKLLCFALFGALLFGKSIQRMLQKGS
ncbi:oligosaccharide flippase family protein [Saprospira sp. CCB-QB6]|uniref:lipopolysaccharide biosynthesis protein n=1 Tax=Saprospira sp. CCB-QB6 TaxID=3023936 RepID=UPI0023490176|nr:oligosaccharide flippase family protein [Saprospira sp. CCB-QB6]WCL82578.1 oligosaccharide flippase family protein [Saprospira sp. CCB-QB6]